MKINRRDFVKATAAGVAGAAGGCIPRIHVRSPYASGIPDVETSLLVNDLPAPDYRDRVGAGVLLPCRCRA